MSDQERISPYNINTKSSKQMMRIKKNVNRRLLIDPIPKFPKSHEKSEMETLPQ